MGLTFFSHNYVIYWNNVANVLRKMYRTNFFMSDDQPIDEKHEKNVKVFVRILPLEKPCDSCAKISADNKVILVDIFSIVKSRLLWVLNIYFLLKKTRKNCTSIIKCTTVYFSRFIYLLSDIFLLLFKMKTFYDLTYWYILLINFT